MINDNTELDWSRVDGGSTIGTPGSESGTIICDEVINGYGRITLEKCPKYYAITCGVYGGLVHTAFCSPENADSTYAAMKYDLLKFFKSDFSNAENFYDTFTTKY